MVCLKISRHSCSRLKRSLEMADGLADEQPEVASFGSIPKSRGLEAATRGNGRVSSVTIRA